MKRLKPRVRVKRRNIQIFGWVLFLCLSTMGFPQGCEGPPLQQLTQFKYLADQEGFDQPQQGEVTLYRTNGPVGGGSVQALAKGPDGTIYASIFGDGIYRSMDEGDSWKAVKKGLKDLFILSLMVGPDHTVYAGGIRGGVFISHDQGAKWVSSNDGLTNTQIPVLVMDQNQDIYAGTGKGVFISQDGGKRWSPANKGLEMDLVRSIAVSQEGTIFAGTAGGGMFRSGDRGKNWVKMNQGLRDDEGLRENFIRVLTFDEKRKALFAGTFGGGIFQTPTQGEVWEDLNRGLGNLSIRGIILSGEHSIYVGTGQGVYNSSNRGKDWNLISQGMEEDSVQSMLLGKNETLFVGTPVGMYRKKVGEKDWEYLHKGLLYQVVQSVAVNEERGYYAATGGGGVYHTKDFGNLWFQMNQGLKTSEVFFLAHDRSRTLYAGTNAGVYLANRAKRKWILLDEGLGPQAINSFIITGDDVLFVGTAKGLFSRSASGVSWNPVEIEGEQKKIKGLSMDSDGFLYGVGEQDIFKREKGNEWTKILSNPLPKDIAGVSVVNDVFYAWNQKAVFKGELNNKGRLGWKDISLSFDSSLSFLTLAVRETTKNSILYLGTTKGLFWSKDGGTVWKKAKGYLPDAPIYSISVPSDGILLVGTGDRGVMIGADLVSGNLLLGGFSQKL